MRPRKLALLLVVLGVVLLPAPVYLGAAAEATAPTPRTSQVYAAERLDPANDSDVATLAGRHETTVALSVHQVSERYSAGEYRAPNETREALRTAMADGSAAVDDPAARADLRAIAAEHEFVYDAYGDDDQFYRLVVSENGSTVAAKPVGRDRVGAEIVRQAPRYENLSAAERRTVDRIVENASYRPRVDAAFVDRLPGVVRKGDTVYSIYVTSHVDDLGPGFTGFVYGLYVAVGGGVLVVVGAAVYAVDRFLN